MGGLPPSRRDKTLMLVIHQPVVMLLACDMMLTSRVAGRAVRGPQILDGPPGSRRPRALAGRAPNRGLSTHRCRRAAVNNIGDNQCKSMKISIF
jgi:hypothetical protein